MQKKPMPGTLLKRFEQAVRDHEMLGTQPPEAHGAIESRYWRTRQEVLNRLSEGDA